MFTGIFRCITVQSIPGKLTNSIIFDNQKIINFDLDAYKDVRKWLKTECQYFSISEIWETVEYYTWPTTDKSHLWMYRQIDIFEKIWHKYTKWPPEWHHFEYNEVLTSDLNHIFERKIWLIPEQIKPANFIFDKSFNLTVMINEL